MTNKNNEVTEPIKEGVTSLNQKITEYNDKLSNLPDSVREEYSDILKDLTNKNESIKKKLDGYKDTSEGALADVQIGLEMAWDDLTIAFNSVKERLDKLTSDKS